MCTTELGEAALQEAEFTKRGVKMIALSCDSVEDHKGWVADIEAARGAKVTYPIISDPRRETAQLLGMLDEDEKDAPGIPATVRKVFLIGPDKKVKLQLIYPTAVGRNFAEILRCIDALQLAATHPIATPVNWQRGQDVMIQPSVSDDKAAELFPGFKRTAVPSGKGCVLCARAQASERANAQAARACSQASVRAIERARSRARPARASGVRLARARERERERERECFRRDSNRAPVLSRAAASARAATSASRPTRRSRRPAAAPCERRANCGCTAIAR